MEEKRTITLNLSADEASEIAQVTGRGQLFTTIGYLSVWNLNYPSLTIMRDTSYNKADLIAVYRKVDGSHGYTIGANWSDASQSYSFNS